MAHVTINSIRFERLTTVKRHFWAVSLWILLPMSLAAGTTRIYVLNNRGTTVNVIDTATNKIVHTIPGYPNAPRSGLLSRRNAGLHYQ